MEWTFLDRRHMIGSLLPAPFPDVAAAPVIQGQFPGLSRLSRPGHLSTQLHLLMEHHSTTCQEFPIVFVVPVTLGI